MSVSVLWPTLECRYIVSFTDPTLSQGEWSAAPTSISWDILSRPVGIKDWLNWTIYFGCLELCNLWYSLSCVAVVISNYNYRRLALLTPHYVLCSYSIVTSLSLVFHWVYVYICAFMYLEVLLWTLFSATVTQCNLPKFKTLNNTPVQTTLKYVV